jgi:hypothetical protein
MSFINVTFGYNQQKTFNINCEIAPLLDAIHTESYKLMKQKLTQREDFFNKEVTNFKKEQAILEKKLEKLEVPVEPPKKDGREGSPMKKKLSTKKKTKKELEAEALALKLAVEEKLKNDMEEAAKKVAEDEEKRKKEEEEAKGKKGGKDKGKKGGKAEEEVVEE